MAKRKAKSAAKKKTKRSAPALSARPKRVKVSQADFPRFSLGQVLRIPQALWDEFAGREAAPHDLAMALSLAPTSGNWRLLCGASIAYGLTEGGYNATKISLTDLGRRIVAPTDEGDDDRARAEAVLQPRVMREFFQKYERAKFPSDAIARNVLVDLGLPNDRAERAVEVLKENGELVGILRETKTGLFVALEPAPKRPSSTATMDPDESAEGGREVDIDPGPRVRPMPATRADSGPSYPVAPTPLRRGMVVDAYKLKQRLGAGFSAEVWSATVQKAPPGTELKRGDTVAVKFYHAHAMALPDQVLRVEREYRIAQSIRHDHLIRIHEFMLASPRPHHSFLVMDVAKGQPMGDLIRQKALAPNQALEVFRQLLSALDALHSAGALHRDIKPGNISVEVRDTSVHATLLDLGIVTVTYEKGVTAVSHFLGSKHWAPIEQLMGEPLDERSDLYGAGAVAFNALTGQEPYANQQTEAAVAVEMSKGPLVLSKVHDVPGDVVEMINACLSNRRSGRPGSARDCIDVLDRHAQKGRRGSEGRG